METDQAVLSKLKALPPEKQQEVLDFLEFIHKKSLEKRPLRNLKGLWADLGVQITEEDIAEVRQEMWRTLPRRDI
ncbi:MAG: DUF2281 domain-containing protein [Deltaproteobacteria bacterium]|nr:MAG: DUF2281 domain-containing protein [Deltaproteobacteria bacterium]